MAGALHQGLHGRRLLRDRRSRRQGQIRDRGGPPHYGAARCAAAGRLRQLKRAGRLSLGEASSQARAPVTGAKPNMPSLAWPLRVSPATVTVKSRVNNIGVVISVCQLIVSPSMLPSNSWRPESPFMTPSKAVSDLRFTLSCASRAPIGLWITRVQSPSTMVLRQKTNAAAFRFIRAREANLRLANR